MIGTQDGQVGWVAGILLDDTLLAATGPGCRTLGLDGLVVSGNAYGTEIYSDEGVYGGLHPGVDVSATDKQIHTNVGGTVYFYRPRDEPPGQPRLAFRRSQTPGWPGRIHPVVRLPYGVLLCSYL